MAESKKAEPKQAVVLIHGMGDQVPMESIEGFVQAVWTSDEGLARQDQSHQDDDAAASDQSDQSDAEADNPKANISWHKPDFITGSSELRRITTPTGNGTGRVDFFEYYWAHLTAGSTISHFTSWFSGLLLRWPSQVPRDVIPTWIVLWVLVLAVAGLLGLSAFSTMFEVQIWGLNAAAWAAISMGLGIVGKFLADKLLISKFGDVARFVDVNPDNVATRMAIRDKGVKFLDSLIQSGRYDRLVVVAHSQGTIVAHDVLSTLFAKYNRQFNSDKTGGLPQDARDELEKVLKDALKGTGKLEPTEYQELQSKALAEAQANGSKWIISDFVTLGSPLTHAEFLLARDKKGLEKKKEARLVATCPPTLESFSGELGRRFTYNPGDEDPKAPRTPHHTALFAYTRWSNLYSPHKNILWGDLISGPLAETMGMSSDGGSISGILDVPVLPDGKMNAVRKFIATAGHKRPFFSHTHYWDQSKGTEEKPDNVAVPHHIDQLRRAVNLQRKPKPFDN